MAEKTVEQKAAELEKKFQKAIDAATVDGVTNMKVTLLGDGIVHDGTGPLGRFAEGDEFLCDPAIALGLAKAGTAAPSRVKA